MPPEPKKPIEELLEASAQARRVEFGSDPEMPNPMRARLQDEVARTAREGLPERRSPWFVISWPRLAIGTAFASLLLAMGVTWWRADHAAQDGRRLAMEQTAPLPEMNRAERADQPPQLARQQAPAESKKAEDFPEIAARANLGSAGSEDEKTHPVAKAAPATQPAAESSRPSASSSSFAAADSVAEKRDAASVNMRQQFSQTAGTKLAGGAQEQTAPKVLDNFQVEQNGSEIRVLDDDGSTYAGRIEPLAAHDSRSLQKEKQAAAPAVAQAKRAESSAPSPNNGFYFRASGYNASLQKSLVFEGNYIVTATTAKDRAAGPAKNAEPPAARIVGTATVPGEPPVSVDAVALPPK